MKLLAATVKWLSEAAVLETMSVLSILVDQIPSMEGAVYRERETDDRFTIYYAEKDGWVHHMYTYKSEFATGIISGHFQVKDLEQKITQRWIAHASQGPCGTVNALGLGPCVHVAYRTLDGETLDKVLPSFGRVGGNHLGVVTLEVAQAAAVMAGVQLVEGRDSSDNPIWYPQRPTPLSQQEIPVPR